MTQSNNQPKTNSQTLDDQKTEALLKPGAAHPAAVVMGTYNLFGWWVTLTPWAQPGENIATINLPPNYYIASVWATEVNAQDGHPLFGAAQFNTDSVQLNTDSGQLRVVYELLNYGSSLPSGLMILLAYIPG